VAAHVERRTSAADRLRAVEAWIGPDVPLLEGRGPDLRLFDTATSRVRPSAPGPTAGMYVCGITPYDATHLGHAFTYLTFDVLQRVWRDLGHRVRYVQNVTDIDDPLLERAVALGEDWRVIARRETELFRSDMAALSVLPPDEYLGAVESIPGIVDIILDLRERGVVYAVDDDWYFDVGQADRFGEISGYPTDLMLSLCAERGGDPDRVGKRHPLDPLMWLAGRPDEPAWDTALGHGRPGWHIECVAIALGTLGMGFDVQGGGSDLIFPHHEMGAAHARSVTGEWPYAHHYVHVGMVGFEGHKMSKSRGNLVFVSRLLAEGADPSALRIALQSNHYRGDWEWQDGDLAAATDRLGRWRAAVMSAASRGADRTIEQIRDRLSDDLDIPGAYAALDAWARVSPGAAATDVGAADGAIVARATRALLGIELTEVDSR
jgi:L-cysteine:1D-myo-inositol 2-amino-2-deoxy-alpha-D-glucopyranoside ligase